MTTVATRIFVLKNVAQSSSQRPEENSTLTCCRSKACLWGIWGWHWHGFAGCFGLRVQDRLPDGRAAPNKSRNRALESEPGSRVAHIRTS